MGEVSRQLPTVPAPASLQAAAGDGLVDWRTDPAPGVGTPDDRRWHRSWTYRTPPCRPVVAGPAGCRPGDPRDWDPQRPVVFTGAPFGFEAQLECSVPADATQLGTEARAAFDRGASAAVATELYRGAVSRQLIDDGNDLADGNRWLTRSDDPVSPITELSDAVDGVPLVGALGLLESYLACCSDVGRGVIHAPSSLLPAMLGSGLLEPLTPTGRRYTAGGHLVVADCGYTGEAPGTAEEGPQDPGDGVLWLYATGGLVARVSPTLDLSSDEDVAALIATTNDRVAVSQGLAMVAWGCCHAGVPVDVSPYGLDFEAA